MKTWQEIGFTWLATADGSPTLSLGENQESMHHSKGALSETLMIYGEPLREIFTVLERPRIFSLGLGLGYVEMVAAARALLAGRSFEMLTMESVADLTEAFDLWLQGKLEDLDERQRGLDQVASMIAARTDVAAERIRGSLAAARESGAWRIEGALSPEKLPQGRFNGFMYDAFSAKTSPDLWSEEFLRRLLLENADQDCFFTTYACTGNLKRALKAEGFQFVLRQSFHGKRDSTVGRRGIFSVRQDS